MAALSSELSLVQGLSALDGVEKMIDCQKIIIKYEGRRWKGGGGGAGEDAKNKMTG